jgi:hypothetical protein
MRLEILTLACYSANCHVVAEQLVATEVERKTYEQGKAPFVASAVERQARKYPQQLQEHRSLHFLKSESSATNNTRLSMKKITTSHKRIFMALVCAYQVHDYKARRSQIEILHSRERSAVPVSIVLGGPLKPC